MRYKPLPAYDVACIAPLFILCVVFIVRATHAPYSDFAGYYYGSRLLIGGNYRAAYDTWSLNALIMANGYKGVFASYTPFPPFTAIAIAPFAWLPMAIAKLVFNCVSALLFIFTLLRCCRFFSLPSLSLLLATLIFYIPVMNNINFGQAYLLLFVLLAEGYMAYKKGHTILSSFLWAFAIVFKIFPLVLLVFLVLRKRYRHAVYLGIAAGLLCISSLLMPNGFAAWKFYLSDIMPRLGNGELNNSFTYMFQSAFMLLKNGFVYDGLLNPHPAASSPLLFITLLAVFKACIIAGAVMITIREKDNDFIAFSAWITAAMLFSPNGSSYSLVLLVIPFLQLTDNRAVLRLTRKGLWIAAMLLLFLLVAVPVYRLSSWPLLLKFPRLYLLILFFGALLLQSARVFNYKVILLFFALFFLPGLVKPAAPADSSTYFLTHEEHILIINYGVEQGRLVYDYFDDTGIHRVQTGYAVSEASADNLFIRDNQLWYHGKQLTSSPDRKMNPLLINRRFILYLSDKNRGIGFYTLRMLIPEQALRDAGAWPAIYR